MPNKQYESHSDKFTKREPIGNVSSLLEYLEQIKHRVPSGKVLFRGQSRSWTLRPAIDRLRKPTSPSKNDYPLPKDRELLEEYKRLSWPLIARPPETDLGWMAFAQQHGLPTRLLDWTESSLIALWFATCKEPGASSECKDDRGPVVWILRVTPEYWCRDALDPFSIKGFRVFAPPIVTPRLRAQRGIFTVSQILRQRGSMENRKRNTKRPDAFYLEYLTIDRDKRQEIISDLEQQGIDESSVFPDTKGIAQLLERKALEYANGKDPWG